jgi:translation initiation factor eIF-2B subunit epsilon
MTTNASWHQVRRAVVTALITRIEQVVTQESLTNKVATKNVFERWLEIITRCIHERKDQSDFLLLAQKECCGRKAGESLLLNFVQVLNYDLEVIDEEAVHDWWLNEASTKDDKMKAVRKPTEAFVKWLSEAESESEESGEEGDDEESDEE